MAIAYLSLGSNKGDRVGYVQQATSLLSSLNEGEVIFKVIRTSSLYETQPWHEKNTTWFVNAIIEIKTNLSPQDLLTECLKIEKLLGRNREIEGRYGDRTIDIDILFYGPEIISEDNLQIPHEHLHERAFVLVPMLELDPDFIHPVLNKSMADLHEELENPEMVYLYGTRIDGL